MSNEPQTVTPEYIGSQTVGPYYAIGLSRMFSEAMVAPGTAGRHVTISGTLYDADGEPVPDAILELWQATPEGIYSAHPYEGPTPTANSFSGFGRLSTHEEGRFTVHTVAPGPVPYLDDRLQAPHIVVTVFMRGLMRHLVTRMYLPDAEALARDPILQLVPETRRATLIAKPADAAGTRLLWDIHLQGPNETVFFAC